MAARRACWLSVAALLLGLAASAQRSDYTFVVTAPHRGYREAPVTVTVEVPRRLQKEPVAAPGLAAVLRQGGRRVPVQVRRRGGQAAITWLVRDLRQGERRFYAVSLAAVRPRPGASDAVAVKAEGANADVRLRGALVLRYDTTTGPNKPYCYPLYGPDQALMVRRFPLEHAAGETTDHPHHRGLWFTHGAVNGQDYWSEGPGTARTVHTGYRLLQGGPVYGSIEATTDWIDRGGKAVARDVRDIRVYDVPSGRLVDFEVTLQPVGGPLLLGDTKEGSFGLRVPDSIRPASGGHIVNSEGVVDGPTWGKRARWVDYYGPVGGSAHGIAILDDPRNLRHPTYWHVRDYGLFAVNPFGVHDFVRGEPAGAGDFTIPSGGSLTFRYRLYLHRGTTSEARVAEVWDAYSDPPTVEVRR